MISGVLPVDKPVGWTSHDVVARVRRLTGQKQVGHAGTLDPLATGVLLVVMGDATRMSSYLMESSKVYCAEVVLGIGTVTDDAEAPILEHRDASQIEQHHVENALLAWTGEIDQVPPAYSAVRHGGEKLYALARKGVTVQPEPRRVLVHSIDLVSWQAPRARLRIHCGPGTYIRSLARDIGTTLGVGGYLHALRRTVSGTFGLAQCVALSSLSGKESLLPFVQPPDRAAVHLSAVVLSQDQVDGVRMGRPALLGAEAAETVRLYGPDGTFVGLGTTDGESVKPFKVFGGAEAVDARRQSH